MVKTVVISLGLRKGKETSRVENREGNRKERVAVERSEVKGMERVDVEKGKGRVM